MSNRDGFIMGRSDAPLTSQGIDAAKLLSRIIGAEGVQCVISSSLGRAALTAAIHSEQLRIPILVREAIAELSCGSWEGKRRADVIGGSALIRGTWQFRPPGGESYQDAEPRVASLVAEILRMSDREPVLVVGHASVNRVFLRLWMGLTSEVAMNIRSPHEVIYVFERGRGVRYASVSGLSGEGFLIEPE